MQAGKNTRGESSSPLDKWLRNVSIDAQEEKFFSLSVGAVGTPIFRIYETESNGFMPFFAGDLQEPGFCGHVPSIGWDQWGECGEGTREAD
jgi:hypothetical protein